MVLVAFRGRRSASMLRWRVQTGLRQLQLNLRNLSRSVKPPKMQEPNYLEQRYATSIHIVALSDCTERESTKPFEPK